MMRFLSFFALLLPATAMTMFLAMQPLASFAGPGGILIPTDITPGPTGENPAPTGGDPAPTRGNTAPKSVAPEPGEESDEEQPATNTGGVGPALHAKPADSNPDSDTPKPKPPAVRTQATEPAGWHGPKGALYRAAPGTEVKEIAPDRLELSRGEIVIDSTRPVVVVTPLTESRLQHRAAVLFKVASGSERCMVLWDSGPDSVNLISQRKQVGLGPGKEALITDHDPKYTEITQSDEIGRRRIKMHQFTRHQHVITSEFYLLHALQHDPLLYDVAHSKERHDKDLRERILKTAAVLNLVTRGHGYYTTNPGY